MSQFRTPRRRRERELNERRASEADIKHRHYVRPYGNRGLHVVKSAIDGEEYIVSGPGRTFQPGTVVPTGSNTGTQGETILTDPPPGRRGAGGFPPSTIVKRRCPVCLTGRKYIGITDSGSTDIVQAWDYTDGTPLTLLETATLPAKLQTSGDFRDHFELVTPTKIAFIARTTTNEDTVVIWNIGGSLGTGTFENNNFFGKLLYTLGALYFAEEHSDSSLDIMRMLPFIGEGATKVADINVGGASKIGNNDLVMIGGLPHIWSDDLDELPPAEDTRYCAAGSSQFGPVLQDFGSRASGGHHLGSGGSLVGHPIATLVDIDQREQRLWPTEWGSFIGTLRLPLSTQQEYLSSTTTAFTRLPIKDYSGVNGVTCPIPTLPIDAPIGQPFKALLPL
jgi:hypothetical protein